MATADAVVWSSGWDNWSTHKLSASALNVPKPSATEWSPSRSTGDGRKVDSSLINSSETASPVTVNMLYTWFRKTRPPDSWGVNLINPIAQPRVHGQNFTQRCMYLWGPTKTDRTLTCMLEGRWLPAPSRGPWRWNSLHRWTWKRTSRASLRSVR